MSNFRNLKFILILGFLVSLVSCGEYGKGGASLSSYSVGDSVEVQASLDEFAISNIRSICSRLGVMRMDIRSTNDIASVRYTVVQGTCSASSKTYNSEATIQSPYSGTSYLNLTRGFLITTNIETDMNGIMADYCVANSNGDDLNTVYTNHINSGFVYSFPSSNIVEKGMIVVENGTNKLIEKAILTIEANAGQTRNALVEKAEYQSLCSNGNSQVSTQFVEEYILQ